MSLISNQADSRHFGIPGDRNGRRIGCSGKTFSDGHYLCCVSEPDHTLGLSDQHPDLRARSIPVHGFSQTRRTLESGLLDSGYHFHSDVLDILENRRKIWE
jgi:hypothetical protein